MIKPLLKSLRHCVQNPVEKDKRKRKRKAIAKRYALKRKRKKKKKGNCKTLCAKAQTQKECDRRITLNLDSQLPKKVLLQ